MPTRTTRARPRVIETLLALALAAGCAGPGGPGFLNGSRSLDEAQRRYTRLMRWAEFARASDYVAPAEREAFLSRAAELGDVRFTDYELLTRNFDPELFEDTLRVAYRGYRLSSASAISFEEEQVWYRDESGGAWRVRSSLEEQSGDSLGSRS